MDLKNSETHKNLLRAFAGETQAYMRYNFAASEAKKQKLHVIEAVFKFTANQEKEHAEIFYKHLAPFAGQEIEIDGSYPIDISNSVLQLLKYAAKNEYAEHDEVYKGFADVAKEEGFPLIEASFKNVGEIEKSHADRFKMLAELIEQNKLFVSDVECCWMCLKCGHISNTKGAPEQCPVCHHNQGHFIRIELAPFTK